VIGAGRNVPVVAGESALRTFETYLHRVEVDAADLAGYERTLATLAV
jgi:hypothetical protein